MALIPTHSFKFSTVSTGFYEVIERSTGDVLGEVYQQGATIFKSTAQEGDWVCHSYITGEQTTHPTRQEAGQHLRRESDGA